ncbi:S-layer homology domain-containing protein [Ellagibacter isourolithinifaciens]|uniref:S-layer homology domain-containing protein n=1 Tax=Ellagibacter isourolithinifaciens TaxID=2137581 RepID=UPI003A92AA35
MNLPFKEKCISVVLSISLGAFVPSAAFASQDEGDDGSGFRQEITLKDAADNAISETLGASPVVDSELSPLGVDISSASVVLDNSSYRYTGSEIEPGVKSVRLKGVTLSAGEDYEVSYSDNVNAGTAHCVITGIGKYSGSVSEPFTIRPLSLTNAVINDIPDQEWTGSAIEPDVTVSLNDEELVKDIDYTLSYENNVDLGFATVTVDGIGNYTGRKYASFHIVQLLEEGVKGSASSDGKDYFGKSWFIDIKQDSLINLDIQTWCYLSESSPVPYLVSLENEDKSIRYTWSMGTKDTKTYGLLSVPAGKWLLNVVSITKAYHSVSARYKVASTPVGAIVEKENNNELDTATPIAVGDTFMGSIYNPLDAYESAKIGDLDYYKFTLQSPKRLQIRMSNHSATIFGLYDSEDNLVKKGSDSQGDTIVGSAAGDRSGDVILDTGVLPAGTYYFCVTSGDQNTWGKSYYGKISELPPFDDVAADSWYYSGVMFVYEKGLIKGYSGTTLFGVGDTLTRAQLATILYRNANPGVSSDSRPSNTTGMPDVKGGEWYTAGVNWAVENGVINGYADEQGNRFAFGPDDPVTFEQLITVLANCSAKSEDLPSAQESSKVLSSFKDGQSVSAWAQANMAWAVENGLVSGYDEPDGQYLRPGEEVARERVAVILMRAFQSGILK